MGFDKLLYFFKKNSNNISMEIKKNYNLKQLITSSYVIFDINFFIYNSINKVEEEINYILKLILSIQYNYDLNFEDELKQILKKPHWEKYFNTIKLILDGTSILEICNSFKNFLTKDIINNIIYQHIKNNIEDMINKFHNTSVIKKICIFFDGIPNFSKIIEQRRRRLNMYFENKINKSKFQNIFCNLEQNIINEGKLIYSYLDWLKYRFCISKSFGPKSNFILNLENFLQNNIYNYSVYISSSAFFGEADFKIYEYTSKFSNEEFTIHSCDSDLLYLNLVNYVKDMSCNKNNNYIFVKYTNESYDIIYSNIFIKVLIEKFKFINKINDTISNNFLFDFLFIILFFGNDILPNSIEIGIELGINNIFKIYYLLYKESNFIININLSHIINFNNLLLFLNELVNINSSINVVLSRYFKLSSKCVAYLSENYTLDNLKSSFLCPYENNTIKLNTNLLQMFNNNIQKFNGNDNGLIRLEKYLKTDVNTYEEFYNLITNNTIKEIDNKYLKLFPYNFDNIENIVEIANNEDNFNVENYLQVLICYTNLIFGNFEINVLGLFFYKYYIAPPIKQIINYINSNDMVLIENSCVKKFLSRKIFYLDSFSHQILITPYNFTVKENLKFIINYIEEIWYNESKNYNFKNINPYKLITLFYYNSILINIIKYNYNLLLL